MALKSIIVTSVAAAAFAGVCWAETPRQGPKEETIISTAAVRVSMIDQLMRQPLDGYMDNLRTGERWLKADPNDVKGHDIVGMSHFYVWLHYSHDPWDLETAIAALKRGADSDAKDNYSNVALSKVFCVLGRHEDELKELNEAIRRQPEAHAPYSYRAEALRELGRNEEADADKKTALRLKTENGHVARD